MYKGIKGPVSGRTSRTRAEEIGTDPSGFTDQGPGYFSQGGHPITSKLPAQPYKEAPEIPGANVKVPSPKPF